MTPSDLDQDALAHDYLFPTPVGKCERCGREFISLPKDMRDHYLYRKGGNMLCMGTVKRIYPAPGLAPQGGEGVG